MPGSFLTDTERERLRKFPAEIPPEDLIGYFTLSERDRLLVRGQRPAHNRLGFALQVCALRYLGFVPLKLHSAPSAVIGHLAEQLGVASRSLARYGERSRPRTRPPGPLHFALPSPARSLLTNLPKAIPASSRPSNFSKKIHR